MLSEHRRKFLQHRSENIAFLGRSRRGSCTIYRERKTADALKALPDVDDILGQHFPLYNGHTSFFVERRASIIQEERRRGRFRLFLWTCE